MFAVIVEFEIMDGRMPAFLPLMKENAETSVREEKGCLQFDVVAVDAAPNVIVLYEVYTDRAAFDAHLASDHFKHFDANVGDMIASKSVRTGTAA